ncbi:MAG: DNA-directed RNA polymerase subunit beta [Verrucomicrobia bacterium]|nr:DNA-directed RNA polymerase subunit beta [Verrucomicrobiota bacterium]
METVERVRFGKGEELVELPNLIEMQRQSYDEFLQAGVPPNERRNQGLQAVFNEIFPIASYDGNCILEFVNFSLGVPKYDPIECQRRGLTYAVSLKVTFRLIQNEVVREETVYMGTIPIMTDQGTFIVNGAERVVVSQLHRSPGICFETKQHPKGDTIYSFRVIPYRGSWIEAEFDTNNLVHVYIDRRRRRRKILATTFIKALGYGTNEELLELFFEPKEVSLASKDEKLIGEFLARNIVGVEDGIVYGKAGDRVDKNLLTRLRTGGIEQFAICKGATTEHALIQMIQKDPTDSYESALKDIYKKLRPGDPTTIPNARAMIKRLFFDPKRYNLGRVGRFKINEKLGLDNGAPPPEGDEEALTLHKEDVVYALKFLINLQAGEKGYTVDDIDHLGNRRVRSVGELLENQCRIGLARMEKITKERMNLFDMQAEAVAPHKLVNPKGLSGVIRDFFGRSQLSQFMDQTNPVAELTHKRRLSALGPGGLSRERAGFEVRDVHPSHYGRICPIETPEGPNIGLISSLSTYAKINEYGFIVTPYLRVKDGRITDEVVYLGAHDEERYVIAQANVEMDRHRRITSKYVLACRAGDFISVTPEEVDYIDVSPRQLVSVVSALIPFLEHDDANRALMGSNMQRQAVPLLTTEPALVGTGLERRAALDSGVMVQAPSNGTITYVDGDTIRFKPSSRKDTREREYRLRKYMRSNASTCINQRPIVRLGEKVEAGAVLADGPSTHGGELALGRNVLVAFMPWGGYNFEDAILVSERLVKEDLYTSVHIEEFSIGARDTKLGREEITRDIPNVGEDALRNLDEGGIVRIGAEVRPGDILVGKITPKSETELTPEERLLRAIFGEKAADVRDASLTVPSGTEGIVLDVRVFSRKDSFEASEEEKLEEKEQVEEIEGEFRERLGKLNKEFVDQLCGLLSGEKLDVQIIDVQTGEVVIPPGKKITRPMLQQLGEKDLESYFMPDTEITAEIKEMFMEHRQAVEELEMRMSREIEKVKRGDELEPGVIKEVKVYIASKRKLQVGDKMAGRHGNKGVIAKIMPDEDMPFLPDGTPVDMVLNPLGVPSRMNLGQVLETHLGWAAKALGMCVATPVFDGIKEGEIKALLKKAKLPESGKTSLHDGRTGEPFAQDVVVGYIYMMKLSHLVADKIHARAIGPYSLVTQQPLGGKAQQGGQRFGEMEVWALEAYGAAYCLQELLTVKSDDVAGRTRIYESIVKGEHMLEPGTPESFNVLIKEMQALCLDVRAERV